MSKFLIKSVFSRQVYDSRGKPTVEVEVTLDSGVRASAIAPSGASVGSLEAVELREPNASGVGTVAKAVDNVNRQIAKYLVGMSSVSQSTIDDLMIELDGTDNKSNLGANAILPVSLAVAKAAAIESDMPLFAYLGGISAKTLPVPMMNFINGGVHADNMLDIQEFMILPVGAKSFSQAMEMASSIGYLLRSILKSKRLSVNVGDEGGFAIDVGSADAVLDLLMLASERAGYTPGEDVLFALDIAASELYEDGIYHFRGEGERMKTERLIAYYRDLILNYPIFSIEDPMAEDDSAGFRSLTEEIGEFVQLVGDDVFVTSADLLQEGIDNKICNAVLVKPNQVGTLTETMLTVSLAKRNNYETIISHRSGETEDVTIAHLAVGLGSLQIKTGALSRTDRVAKYNELLRIEEGIGKRGNYAGDLILQKYKRYRLRLGK